MIIVFGSIFMDVTFPVEGYPQRDTIVPCGPVRLSAGGKGANQAVAAARAGAKVFLVGKVGSDLFGERILSQARVNGVATSGVGRSELATGVVGVVAEPDGTNTQIAGPGANRDVTHDQIPDDVLTPDNMVITGLWVPREQVRTLLARAAARGCRTVLNLSPIKDCLAEFARLADILTVNRDELFALAGQLGVLVAADDPRAVLRAVVEVTGKDVVATLGSGGVIAARPDGAFYDLPVFDVDSVVDTNGAGDCFAGIFSGLIYRGEAWETALRLANIGAALSCQTVGAFETYPYLEAINEVEKDLE